MNVADEKYGIFTPFIILYILFNGIVILLNISSVLDYYIFLVVFILLSLFGFSNRFDFYKINFFYIDEKKVINKIFLFTSFIIIIFALINKNSIFDILNYQNLLLDKYDIRINGMDVPQYSIFFENIVVLHLILTCIFLVKQDKMRYVLSFLLYILFYLYTLQKAPIVTMFVIHFLLYIHFFKLNYKFVILFILLICITIVFFFFSVFGTFDISKSTILFDAISHRITLAGDLVIATYHHFDETNLLNGASFPIFFGIVDLNVFEADRISLTSLMMQVYYGQNFGGANSSFITDGFANFGYGFDILMIFILLGYIYIMIYLSKIILDRLFLQLYKLMIMTTLIRLVHIQFWSFLETLVFFLIILKIINILTRIRIEKDDNINSTQQFQK
jgi:hypothetical protein